MSSLKVLKLKEQLLQGTYYYQKSELFFKGKVYNIVVYDDGELEIFFNGGIVGAYSKRLKQIRRPANIIEEFKWCYLIKNSDNENIGYIGLPNEKEK